jgi:hypothetical protein
MRAVALLCTLGVAAVCGLACGPTARPPQPRTAAGQFYVTWDTLETDKLASIWLIKRFLDTEARFAFVPKHTLITHGVPFDTPDAEFRRYQTLSCFQSILEKRSVTNATLLRIGEFTHDIEINYWGEKRFPDSVALAARLNDIIGHTGTNPLACVEEALSAMDALYEAMRGRGL